MSRVLPFASTSVPVVLALLGSLRGVSGCSSFGASDSTAPNVEDAGASDGANTTAPPGLPGAPAGILGPLSATEDDQASTLSFAPPDDSGSAITVYQYDVNGDDMWRSLGPDHLALGLTNGTTYRFRVRAVNAVGPSGSPSEVSNAVVPYGAPKAPVVTAKVTGVRIEWTWTAPDGNGRAVVGYQTKLDSAAYGATAAPTTFAASFNDVQTHTLCVKALTSGDAPRNESAEQCTPAKVTFPTAVASVTGDGFTTAVAGGTNYNNEIVSGKTYTINGACFTSSDIFSNNGWWYRNLATGHWAAATIFTMKTNQIGAPRVNGGAGTGCN